MNKKEKGDKHVSKKFYCKRSLQKEEIISYSEMKTIAIKVKSQPLPEIAPLNENKSVKWTEAEKIIDDWKKQWR